LLTLAEASSTLRLKSFMELLDCHGPEGTKPMPEEQQGDYSCFGRQGQTPTSLVLVRIISLL